MKWRGWGSPSHLSQRLRGEVPGQGHRSPRHSLLASEAPLSRLWGVAACPSPTPAPSKQ